MLRRALALWSTRVVAVAATALGLALCTVPLFGVHGVESALVLGATLPTMVAVVATRLRRATQRAGAPATGLDLAADAVGVGLTLLALPVLVLGLNAFRVKTCAPLEGLAFIALGPGMGVVLASLVGTVLGASALRPIAATLAAAASVVGVTLLAVVRLWATPAIFAYGHFFGYLPGSFYDEIVPIPEPLFTLRAVTATMALGVLAVLHACYDPDAGVLRPRALPGKRSLALVGSLALAAGPIAEGFGDALGLRASVAAIEAQLGAEVTSERCELVVPRELPIERRERLARHCDFRVAQMERFFGVREPTPVRVYLFRSPGEKRALMGAASTNIAKPWRHEVYLQQSGWPHPVLAHEIAHVIAGHVAPGPFRLSGRLGGLWPDAALVEGAAVAAAWEGSSSSGLTPHESVHAMIALGIAPSLRALFGAGFFGQQKGLAYTVTGSLLRWIHQTRGAETLRQVYRSGDLAGSLGTSLDTLEAQWRAFVTATPLPEDARALAELRFSGASVLSSVCPHQVAAERQVLSGALAAGDAFEATESCGRILAMDDADHSTRGTLAALAAREGDHEAATRALATLEAGAPAALVAHTRHALADEAWRNGEREEARRTYEALLTEPQTRDQTRLLQVKAIALSRPGREEKLLFDLLVGAPGQRVDGATAVYLCRELREVRDDGLPHYLESRQLLNNERFEPAAALLAEARARGLPSEALEIEAIRIVAMARYAIGDRPGARRLFHLEHRRGDAALRAEAEDWLARIRHDERTER